MFFTVIGFLSGHLLLCRSDVFFHNTGQIAVVLCIVGPFFQTWFLCQTDDLKTALQKDASVGSSALDTEPLASAKNDTFFSSAKTGKTGKTGTDAKTDAKTESKDSKDSKESKTPLFDSKVFSAQLTTKYIGKGLCVIISFARRSAFILSACCAYCPSDAPISRFACLFRSIVHLQAGHAINHGRRR